MKPLGVFLEAGYFDQHKDELSTQVSAPNNLPPRPAGVPSSFRVNTSGVEFANAVVFKQTQIWL